MMLGSTRLQPTERLDVDIDFTDWLASAGSDSIVSATVTTSDPAWAIEPPLVYFTKVRQWLSNGVNRRNYKVTVRVATTQGRVKEVEFRVMCRDR